MTEYHYSPQRHLRLRIEQLRRLEALPNGCPQVILERQHQMIRVMLEKVMRATAR
jgi:hypothetical protein